MVDDDRSLRHPKADKEKPQNQQYAQHEGPST